MDNLSEKVRQALQKIPSPLHQGEALSPRDIVSEGLVSPIIVVKDKVFFSISIPEERACEMEKLRIKARQVALEVSGVNEAVVTLTASLSPEEKRPVVATKGPPSFKPSLNQENKNYKTKVIAVASGKGGVGKSTTAINLALALAQQGQRTGLLDADIYGPSLPRLVGLINHKAPLEGTKIKPLEKFDLQLMSMGFLVHEEQPIAWRAPMLLGALHKLLHDVAWQELDVLVVDLPPGTGDIQLTLAKTMNLCGVVLVSTPQEVALTDVIKTIGLFKKMNVSIIGLLENMSYFIAPDTKKRYDIFGTGKVEKVAKEAEITFLGAMPLLSEISQCSDKGAPIVVSEAENISSNLYEELAKKILALIKK